MRNAALSLPDAEANTDIHPVEDESLLVPKSDGGWAIEDVDT